MKTNDNFSDFSPDQYLAKYYGAIGHETDQVLKFYHSTYEAEKPDGRLVEIGGGPTIYQLISASKWVDEILFSEYLEANRNAVSLWLKRSPAAFDWKPYFKKICLLEKISPTPDSIDRIEERLRPKITQLVGGDVFQPDPLGSNGISAADVLSINFCLESITSEAETFKRSLSNVTRILKPGGLFRLLRSEKLPLLSSRL